MAPIREHLLEMSHRKLKAGGIKDYVISLMCNDPEKVRQLYKRAHQYHTETRLIREQLRHKLSNELDGNPDEVDDKLVKQSMDTLTGNDRKAVLKDALERLASTPQHQHERRSSISASGSTADATR